QRRFGGIVPGLRILTRRIESISPPIKDLLEARLAICIMLVLPGVPCALIVTLDALHLAPCEAARQFQLEGFPKGVIRRILFNEIPRVVNSRLVDISETSGWFWWQREYDSIALSDAAACRIGGHHDGVRGFRYHRCAGGDDA